MDDGDDKGDVDDVDDGDDKGDADDGDDGDDKGDFDDGDDKGDEDDSITVVDRLPLGCHSLTSKTVM